MEGKEKEETEREGFKVVEVEEGTFDYCTEGRREGKKGVRD